MKSHEFAITMSGHCLRLDAEIFENAECAKAHGAQSRLSYGSVSQPLLMLGASRLVKGRSWINKIAQFWMTRMISFSLPLPVPLPVPRRGRGTAIFELRIRISPGHIGLR